VGLVAVLPSLVAFCLPDFECSLKFDMLFQSYSIYRNVKIILRFKCTSSGHGILASMQAQLCLIDSYARHELNSDMRICDHGLFLSCNVIIILSQNKSRHVYYQYLVDVDANVYL